MFHRLLLVPALLALTTVPGAAQSSVPVCVSYANWSTAVAATEIVLGIANQESVPDCYGDNWAMCNSAAVHFNTAYNNLAQIFNGAAAGPNCLRCIISVLQTQADSLDEQEKILYAKGFRSDIGAISRTLKTWAGTPYCAPAAAAPALVPLGPGSAATAGPGTASTAGIAGSYICVVKCQPGGRPARIDQSGSSLTFTNEGGGMSAGSLAGPGIVSRINGVIFAARSQITVPKSAGRMARFGVGIDCFYRFAEARNGKGCGMGQRPYLAKAQNVPVFWIRATSPSGWGA